LFSSLSADTDQSARFDALSDIVLKRYSFSPRCRAFSEFATGTEGTEIGDGKEPLAYGMVLNSLADAAGNFVPRE
jgi:hypothetical protein